MAFEASVLRQPDDHSDVEGRWRRNQPEARPATDEPREHGSEAHNEPAGAGIPKSTRICFGGLTIARTNQVWAADITYIPLARSFAYLVAIIDWYSRSVLAWRLSNTLDTGFCIEALRDALTRFGQPAIFNTDQRSQFTAVDFTSLHGGSAR